MSRNYSGSPQFMAPQLTKSVKWVMLLTVAAWIGFQIIGEGYFNWPITKFFALYPSKVIQNFFIWQTLTYIFLHSLNVWHIVFNMLSLWFIGTELEQRWGSKFFIFYYLATGIGSALFYCFATILYTLMTGNQSGLRVPVVGASGSIFGLLIAYGLLFGERTIHFMMLFPMKAKVFVMILGAMEVVNLLNSGVSGGEVANLAHLGGLLSGFLTLWGYTKMQRFQTNRKTKKKTHNLRLVVDNENAKEASKDPKYWN